MCVFIVIENTGAIHRGTPQTFLEMIKTNLERGGGGRQTDRHTDRHTKRYEDRHDNENKSYTCTSLL